MKSKTAKFFAATVVLLVSFAFLTSPLVIRSQTTQLPQSREELLALIQILIARLAALQAQIAARSTTQYGYTFTRDLTLGNTGQDVSALQQFLVAKGFMQTVSTTGNGTFGPVTQNALASFQRARRITPVAGFFGPTTRAIVNSEATTVAFNFGTSGGGGIAYNPTYGIGGSGNAPTTPQSSGGGGGGGSSHRPRNSSNNSGGGGTPTPTGSGQCSDGVDNDSDGLTDYPIDPGCTSASGDEGANPSVHVTYAFKHYGAGGPDGSENQCTGSGTTYTCHPISNFHNVIYPWVLDWRGDSLNVYKAKAYMDALPADGGRGMFSWVMDAANTSQGNFYRDADNCKDLSGNTITYTYTGSLPIIVDNAGNSVSSGGQAPYRCPWMDDWYSVVQPRWNTFFRDYAAIGGKVDVVTVDNESGGGVTMTDWTKIPTILANPKYNQVNNNFPTSELAHGPVSTKLQGLASLITNQTACDAVNCLDQVSNFFWDWYSSYLNQATYAPLHAYFPNAALTNFAYSNYDFTTYRAPIYYTGETCISGAYCGKFNIFGNSQQPGLLYISNVSRPGYLMDKVHPYQNSTFSKIREDADFVKISRLSNPSAGMSPLYANSRLSAAGSPGIYAEDIFHSLAAGSNFLNMWHAGTPAISEERDLSLAMDEFDGIAGFNDKQTLMFDDTALNSRLTQADPSAWNDDYLLTGISSGGRIVWRFTPETGVISDIPNAASSLISEDPPTFRTAQHHFVFPEGKIYRPANPQSNLGFWIIQPAGAPSPIISASDTNVPPVAQFAISNLNRVEPNLVLFDSSGSFDPDSDTIVREFDFDGDGVFGPTNHGDDVRLADGLVCPMNNCGPYFGAHWFNYLYLTGGTHTVTLRVTDAQGATNQVTHTFTIPTDVCDHPFYECYLTLSAATDFGKNLASADQAPLTHAITVFWQKLAGLILKPFIWFINLFHR